MSNSILFDWEQDEKKLREEGIVLGYKRSVYDRNPVDVLHDFKEIRELFIQRGEESLYNKIEQELERFVNNQADFLHAIDEAAIVGITDEKGTILHVNDSFCRISKYRREELIGKTHGILKSGFHSEEFYRSMWETINSGKTWRGQIKNQAKDGTFYWVQTTIIPIKDDNGRIAYHIAIRTDITEGKRIEHKLRETMKEDFNRTIGLVNSIIFRLKRDEKGNVIHSFIDGKLSKQLGLHLHPIENQPLYTFLSPEKAVFLEDQYEVAFEGRHHTFKFFLFDIWLHVSLTPIMRHGKVIEVVGIASDITEFEKVQKRIHHLAYYDELTGLPNRRKLLEDLQLRMNNHEEAFAAFYIDINDFKQVNDTMGFLVGDQLLMKMEERLQGFFEDASLYRIGEDEFMVLLDWEDSQESLSKVADELLSHMDASFSIDEHEIGISYNLGISHFPDLSYDAESLLQHTHIALQKCKSEQKAGYVLYSEQISNQYKKKVEMEQELKKAVKNGELTLHYQPKMDIRNDKVAGVEALVRWKSSKYGFVPPGDFIPLAEETGLISSIDDWVLTEACIQAKTWIKEGYPPVRIAVNISALELKRVNFVDKVKKVLEDTQLDPAYLEIEITENSFLTKSNISVLQQLKELGVYLSIDDFGTGYSSLGYLKSFPIHALKIDQSFIFDLLASESDADIVRAIIRLAQSFNLNVIAEGVEDEKTLSFLYENGCDFVQGFYY
ncbi:MAG TPA: EAL domain-containing protein, partial [Chondromyces sp.]|nr:EAL domain-containing protein [Chondromyces sp.]